MLWTVFNGVFFPNHRYKESLVSCFSKEGMEVVFYERNYKTSHMQIQVTDMSCRKSITV